MNDRRYWLWKAIDRPLRNMERLLIRRLIAYFKRQEAGIFVNLSQISPLLPKERSDTVGKNVKPTPTDLTELIVFDFDTEVGELVKVAKPHIQGAAIITGEQASSDLISGFSFDVTNTTFLEEVDKRALKFAKDVTQTTLSELEPKIKTVLKRGGNTEQVREAIQGVFDKTSRGTASRARLIARTEMTASGSLGNLEAFRQTGVTPGKEWLSSKDAKVRDTHQIADGTVIPLGDNFNVGGAILAGPGVLISGDTGEIMNCRCVLLPSRLPS